MSAAVENAAVEDAAAEVTRFTDGVHVVQVYESDDFLVDALARFVADGLDAGDAIVVIATDAHRRGLEARLAAVDGDATAARADGRLVVLDAAETLAGFMVDGSPDAERFAGVIRPVIERALTRGAHVRAFGEMVGVLWAAGARDAAIRLEHLWNDLGREVRFGLLCAYPLTILASPLDGAAFEQMCATHSHVLPAESYAMLADRDERLRHVARLQQRAAAATRAEATVARYEEEMADFFENAAVPLHLVGPDGTILRANRAELELLGYEAAEYVGRPIREFHVDAPVIDDMLKRLAAGETLRAYASRLRCRDGSIKHVAIDSNVFWRDGRFVHTRCFTRDITAAKELEVKHRQLAAIVASSDDAIVGKTLDGIVSSWNKGAERIFGYTAEEMVGQPISRIMPPDRAADLQKILGAIRRGERVDHFESERIRKDGRRIDVSLTVSPVYDERGRIVGASKIARDVTERKLAEAERDRLLREAEDARAQAEAATRAKDEFLSVVSHELRTPLASILGWAAVLKTHPTPERAARAVETIERSGRIQAKLIEDLLDVSRIISGRMRLDLRLVDLPTVIRDALETIGPTAEAKGVRLCADVEPGAGPVAGDTDRLHQVVWNLLSNAVKFTPAGGTVTIHLVRRDDDVRLVVRDTGCGITAGFLPFVFERFRQAENVATRRTGGLGLGLAIVRHLVELHGGTVAVESAGDGQGATFTVTLPLMTLRGDSAATDRLPQLLGGVDVLLVEDDEEARTALAAILEAHGARVAAVGSAEAALAALGERRPTVLVSDIGLPGRDGYELLRDLRAAPALRSVPAIAVTGSSEHDVERVRAAGYQLRLVKPVDPDLLVTTIAQLSARRARPR